MNGARLPGDPKILDAYVGRHSISKTATFTITREGDRLFGERNGRPRQALLPETDTVFFRPGAPRTRRLFARDASGRVTRMIDRRDGRDVVRTRSENP